MNGAWSKVEIFLLSTIPTYLASTIASPGMVLMYDVSYDPETS